MAHRLKRDFAEPNIEKDRFESRLILDFRISVGQFAWRAEFEPGGDFLGCFLQDGEGIDASPAFLLGSSDVLA